MAALHLRADENGTAPVRVHPGDVNCSASATAVALRFGSSASAPSAAWRRVPRHSPSSGSSSSNTIVALGERAGLVEAHDVDPGEALDRGQLLHQHLAAGERHRREHEGDAGEQHEALGHHRDHAGDGRAQRGVELVVAELAPEQQRATPGSAPR